MDGMEQGAEVVAESPAAQPTEPQAPTAGSQNTVNTGQPPVMRGFHEHPDWQRMVRERATDRVEREQMQRELQEHRAWRQEQERAARGPQRSAEEQNQRLQARQAIKELLGEDDDWKALQQIKEKFGQLEQGYQGVQKLSEAQLRAQTNQARDYVKQIAEKANLSTDSEALSVLMPAVVGAVRRIPNGEARYEQGDMTVLNEALDKVKTYLVSKAQRETATGVLQTKQTTQRLPPRPSGGAVGQEAPPALEPGKERQFLAGLHRRAGAVFDRAKATGRD